MPWQRKNAISFEKLWDHFFWFRWQQNRNSHQMSQEVRHRLYFKPKHIIKSGVNFPSKTRLNSQCTEQQQLFDLQPFCDLISPFCVFFLSCFLLLGFRFVLLWLMWITHSNRTCLLSNCPDPDLTWWTTCVFGINMINATREAKKYHCTGNEDLNETVIFADFVRQVSLFPPGSVLYQDFQNSSKIHRYYGHPETFKR